MLDPEITPAELWRQVESMQGKLDAALDENDRLRAALRTAYRLLLRRRTQVRRFRLKSGAGGGG